MTVRELLEAMRLDWTKLDKTLIDEMDGNEIYIRTTKHLHDERETGIARGDTLSLKETKLLVKNGLRKFVRENSVEALLNLETLEILAKTSVQKRVITNQGSKKVPLYTKIVLAKNKFKENGYNFIILTMLSLQEKRYGARGTWVSI